jgi:hypothetical protein
VTVKAYGVGNSPLLDCSVVGANASFVKTVGQTNVYEIAVTVDYASSEPHWNSVWENNTRLVRASSVANCDATPGSMYASNDNAASVTLYVHASDSTSVIANGKTYEYAKCGAGFYSFDFSNNLLDGVRCRRNLWNGGSIKVGPYSNVHNCTAEEGNAHSMFLRRGSNAYDCTLLYAYNTVSNSMLVLNENSPNGENTILSGCVFEIDPAAPGAGANAPCSGHNNVSGYFGTVILTDCAFIGFVGGGTYFGFNHSAAIVLNNPTFTNCKYGISASASADAAPGCEITVNGLTWDSNVASQRAVNYTGAMIPLTVNNALLVFRNTTDAGYITMIAACEVAIYDSVFQCETSGVSSPVYITNPGAVFTSRRNNFAAGSENWSSYHYNFTADASGMTWDSDYNVFDVGFCRFNIFGSTYLDLATYKAAVAPEDANSVAV